MTDLSVVLPVYRAAPFVAERIRLLDAYLASGGLDYEIVAVDDGSPDETPRVLAGLGLPRVRALVGGPNRGKFGALKRGVAGTRGRSVVFTDADVPYELAALPHFARVVLDGGFHLAIGDRTLPGSRYADAMPPLRRFATRTFQWCLRVFFTGGLHDTQCGLKAFRGDVARALFPLLREEGFAGDVELLYLAIKRNLAIRRVPVRLRFQGPSTVSAARDGLGMLGAIFRVRARHRAGAYASAELDRIAAQDYGDAAEAGDAGRGEGAAG